MEMVATHDAVFVAGHSSGTRSRVHRSEKHQWLLPLMATAALGWRMEEFEEQYHAGNLKASGFSFGGLAAKFFGSKKPKDKSSADNDDQRGSVAGVVAGEEATDHADRNLDMEHDDIPQDRAMGDQNGEWEDVVEEEQPKDDKKKKRGLFALFGNRKKGGDLEAQDQEFKDGQDAAMEDGNLDRDVPMGEDGYPDDQYRDDQNPDGQYPDDFNPNDADADPTAKQPKKKGVFTGLFGTKKSKSKDPEAIDQQSMDRGLDSENAEYGDMGQDMDRDMSRDMERDMSPDMSGHMDENGNMARSPGMGPDGKMSLQDGSRQPKKQGFFAKLFGKKSKSQDRDMDNHDRPAKKQGFFARLFGGKKSKRQNTDAEGDEYPMETFSDPGHNHDDDGNALPHDDYPESDSHANTQKPKKKGLFSSKKKTNKHDQATDADDESHPGRKRGMFARAKTVSQQNMAERKAKKPGFWARLFGRKAKNTNDDIEMGNLNSDDEARRVGRVKTGSPQLHQGESSARQSAMADVMDDDHDENFEDVPDKKSKKKKCKKDKKEKKDKKSGKEERFGLYRQATMASAATKAESINKKNKKKDKKDKKRQSVYDDHDGGVSGVARPQAARKAPAKVRYAPIAPSEGMHQHVNAPKPRQRGAGRTTAAAANPGNWFWMDVYWK
jgi:collagen type V/XI/XXIV/XXVII alpha